MSLLLDALKKAEEAKRQASASRDGTVPPANDTPVAEAGRHASVKSPEWALEPPDKPGNAPPSAAPSLLPELSAHLESVDADLAAVPTSPPLRQATTPSPQSQKPPPQTRNETAEREAVRNVFAAKSPPPPDRKPLWIALAAAVMAALGIGGWFFWQLQSISSHGSLTTSSPATAIANAPAVATAPPAQPIVQPPPSSPTFSLPNKNETQESDVTASPPRLEKLAKAAAPPPEEPDNPVRITRGKLQIDPNLAKGYELLQAGNMQGAADAYEKAMRTDPRNTDALLGMATISLRAGLPAQAEAWYLRTLESDPKNVIAQAGLINLRGQTDPAFAESRLKSLLASEPESAALNFALGNLYAGQRRWPDAQLSYFQAHTADPGNPDYLFNLAASLDQMHLPKLALDYYQQALTAASSRRAGFDPQQVKARILELKP
ncbi:MAG: tetratricopeptide repeat protein [Zoogloeaceae bacterium]|nr:tetratricopeptide repeat protein [Zoogloeaceae bacterium]